MTHFLFGKYRVSIRRLKDNVLSLSTENKSPVSSTLITDPLKDLFLDYKDHQKFSISTYNKLKPDERKIIDPILKQSGMDEKLGLRIKDDDLGELIERYELLRGQVLAGNDAVEVRKELKHVVLQLVRKGKLPLKKSYDLLLELALLD